MAYAQLELSNLRNGKKRFAPVGFSWTTLLFGFWPALLRRHWLGAIAQLLLAVVTLGFSSLVFPFIYNKWYISNLISDGYSVDDTSWMSLSEISRKLKIELPNSGQLMKERIYRSIAQQSQTLPAQ